MNREIKFRGKRIDNGEWVYGYYYEHLPSKKSFIKFYEKTGSFGDMVNIRVHPDSVGMFTGLQDKNGVDWYHKDIGEFPNGDRFVIEMEEWVEFYAGWIGEAKCEDQTRDFYRIRKAVRLGSTHTHPELLKENDR
jgi:hypothetical protein